MNIQILREVSKFFDSLPQEDGAKILAQLKFLELGQTEALTVKTLKGKIRELIVKQYRIVFFEAGSHGYVVDAFRKKSQKTPKRIIERVEKIYRDINKAK